VSEFYRQSNWQTTKIWAMQQRRRWRLGKPDEHSATRIAHAYPSPRSAFQACATGHIDFLQIRKGSIHILRLQAGGKAGRAVSIAGEPPKRSNSAVVRDNTSAGSVAIRVLGLHLLPRCGRPCPPSPLRRAFFVARHESVNHFTTAWERSRRLRFAGRRSTESPCGEKHDWQIGLRRQFLKEFKS
jgi:hypothetical protein